MRHNGLGQTFGRAIALLVSAMLVPTGDAFAYQVAQTASKDIEAADYLAQADKVLECDPAAARTWAKKALDTASSVRSADPVQRDMVATLKSQSNIKFDEAQKRFDGLNRAGHDAQELIKKGELESAEGRIEKADPKSCYAGFSGIKGDIADRKAEAAARIQEGDAVVARKPKQAIKIYVSARRIDAEYPTLGQKIDNAQQAYARMPKKHVARNLIITLLILGGVSYGLYVAAQHAGNGNGN